MNKKTKEVILRRISIAQGHLGKVKKMLEEDAYCPDVIHQSQAVQASLRKIDEKILDSHLNSCVLGGIHDENKKKEVLAEEIMEVFRKMK